MLTLFRTNASILPTVRSAFGVGLGDQPLPFTLSAVFTGTHLATCNDQFRVRKSMYLHFFSFSLQLVNVSLHSPPHYLHPWPSPRSNQVHSACWSTPDKSWLNHNCDRSIRRLIDIPKVRYRYPSFACNIHLLKALSLILLNEITPLCTLKVG